MWQRHSPPPSAILNLLEKNMCSKNEIFALSGKTGTALSLDAKIIYITGIRPMARHNGSVDGGCSYRSLGEAIGGRRTIRQIDAYLNELERARLIKVDPIEKESLNKRIRRLMDSNGIKSKDLAKDLGVNCQTLYKWVKGDTKLIHHENLIGLSIHLGVSLDYLLIGSSMDYDLKFYLPLMR